MNRIDSKNILREPLLHFLMIGAALFLIYDVMGRPAALPGGQQGSSAEQIIVSRDAVERVTTQYERTWQRQPTEEEQKGLIEDLVRSEIYYREAVAIGLDRDDEVLKRRLRQKMEFIFEDITAWAEPSDADLTAFMKKNQEKYLSDPRLSFRQVFISKDKRGKDAESDAGKVLAQITAGADPASVGDATMLPADAHLLPLREINAQFGEEFGKSLLELKPGTWGGPVKSVYGLHLVLVQERQNRRQPDLKDVRETVKRDWLVEKQKELKDAAYAKIRDRYVVIIEKPRSEALPLAKASKSGVVSR